MNNTLRYGFNILEYLAADGGECSTTRMAEALDLSKSQVSRVLQTLSETGYVSRNPHTRRYFINLSVLKLAHNSLNNLRQRSLIRPYMQELVDTFHASSFSSVPVGLEAIVCDVLYPKELGSSALVIKELGAVNCPYTTSSGKICAAYLSHRERAELFQKTPPVKKAANSLMSFDDIEAEYEKIRNNGVGTSASEMGPGINSAAAPVFNRDGELAATIGVALPDGELDDAIWRKYVSKVRLSGSSASFALGYPLNGQ